VFLHRKELIQPVNVGTPDAGFGTSLLEQFGGATGELTAALQYWVQSFHVENAGIRDMLQDIRLPRVPVKDERGTTRGGHSLGQEYGGGRRRDGAA
jgi:hypothetical protein